MHRLQFFAIIALVVVHCLDLSLLAFGFLAGAGIFEGDHAFRECFVFEQSEFALGEATGEKR